MKHAPLALALLVVGLVTHYGWQQVGPEMAAEAWNVGGAFGRLFLIGLAVTAYRSLIVAAVGAWWAFEELQVIVCGTAWLISPWQVETGAERCSSWLDIPLGTLGLLVAMVLAYLTRQGEHRG